MVSLDGNALLDVIRGIVVAQLLYASPAWWGFLKADEKAVVVSPLSKRLNGMVPPYPIPNHR